MFAAAAVMAACEGSGVGPIGVAGSAVIGGLSDCDRGADPSCPTSAPNNTKWLRHNAVVKIRDTIGSNDCTGTLISPTLVVTAAHCLLSQGAGFNAREIVISGPNSDGSADVHRGIATAPGSCVTHPLAFYVEDAGALAGTSAPCFAFPSDTYVPPAHDIALITLDAPVSPTVAMPMPVVFPASINALWPAPSVLGLLRLVP